MWDYRLILEPPSPPPFLFVIIENMCRMCWKRDTSRLAGAAPLGPEETGCPSTRAQRVLCPSLLTQRRLPPRIPRMLSPASGPSRTQEEQLPGHRGLPCPWLLKVAHLLTPLAAWTVLCAFGLREGEDQNSVNMLRQILVPTSQAGVADAHPSSSLKRRFITRQGHYQVS